MKQNAVNNSNTGGHKKHTENIKRMKNAIGLHVST